MHDDGLRCFELAQPFLPAEMSQEKISTVTNAVYTDLHEDLSTESTNNFLAGAELEEKPNDIQYNVRKEITQYTKKARSYAKLEFYDLAIEACDHLLLLNKDDKKSLALKSDCLRKKNALKETCDYFKKCVATYQKELKPKLSGPLSIFYNQALAEKKKRQAEEFNIAIGKVQSFSEIPTLLQLYLKKDFELSKKFNRLPNSFTHLLNDLSDQTAKKRCVK
jgi:tetratricopeptide (TPR) repeat protein